MRLLSSTVPTLMLRVLGQRTFLPRASVSHLAYEANSSPQCCLKQPTLSPHSQYPIFLLVLDPPTSFLPQGLCTCRPFCLAGLPLHLPFKCHLFITHTFLALFYPTVYPGDCSLLAHRQQPGASQPRSISHPQLFRVLTPCSFFLEFCMIYKYL